PLLASKNIHTTRLPVILIDALDECGGLEGTYSEDRRRLMQTIKLFSDLPKKFKLILTSRVESDIDYLLSEINHQAIEVLAGERTTMSSFNDIQLFLEDRFASIAVQHRRSLPTGWPGPPVIKDLTEKAGGLFIWAETVIRFIQGGEPKSRLTQILEGKGGGGLSGLYSRILHTSFSNPDDIGVAFGSVVGTIIMAKAPLSMSSLTCLLSLDETTVDYICTGLQSVLDSTGLLRFTHQSFVDFVLDENDCNSHFLINQDLHSQELALSCLHTMKRELKFNICQLEDSHLRNRDVVDLKTRVGRYIPGHLSYSCYFWVDHLTKTKCDEGTYGPLDYFIKNLFLYWLEVLSVSNQVGLAGGVLAKLTKWMR
ncbi:12444_t:CDS:1, partial [Acaulospora colombiana]